MPHSLTFFYNHVVFSTKYRLPWITEDLAPKLYAYMTSIVQDKRCHMLEINGADDHVHMLVNFHATCAPATVIGAVKANSSRIGKELYGIEEFGWQDGYGGFSVSESMVEAVRKYIRKQREHHKTESFEDEMRRICKAYNVEPDKNFLKGVPPKKSHPSHTQT